MKPTQYVLARGTNSMVKDAEFFLDQKANSVSRGEYEWWTLWKPVYVAQKETIAEAIEAARELAAHMTPIDNRWTVLTPHLPDDAALNPDDPIYQACQGRWRSPLLD